MRSRSCWLVLLLSLCVPAPVRAELVAFEIVKRAPFAAGQSFGTVGPYEQITGIARFAVDPRDAHNRVIVDLDLTPRNAAGLVEFAADVEILMPADPSKGNGAILYDVTNRGNKLALGMFNRPPGGPGPSAKAPTGDGFLMRRGYTIVWSGWSGELLPGGGRLLLQAPQARTDGKLLRGPVRYETGTDAPAKSLPLSRRGGHGSYPPTKDGEAKGVLTKRLHETDERQVIPRDQWRLVRRPIPETKGGVPGTLPEIRLEPDGGFAPGWLYELVCEAEGAIVQGVGFAGVRDLVSFLRHDATAKNPLRHADGKPAIDRALAFGVSQSGRFLRHFLYLGFDEDEKGEIVFDGLMPHVAGGGLGFFNHRFAQPTRHNAQHEEHLYPADVFPFTYGPSTDPFTDRTDGILGRYAKGSGRPLVIHTQTAAEYWHRSGSLVHTKPDGKEDADIPDNVRIFAFGGTQHGPAADPPTHAIGQNLNNPADYRPFLRALLVALDGWVHGDREPPESVYPRLSDRTLVGWHQDQSGFPSIPRVRYPKVIQQPVYADYGPKFHTHGIISIEPPRVLGCYPVFVPRSGLDGNDLGTLNLPDVAVPHATYTGWNLRRKEVGAEDMLASLLGSYIPLPGTKADQVKSGDPRASLEERYGSFENYRKEYRAACARLLRRRFLLQEDVERLIDSPQKHRKLFTQGGSK